MGVIKAWESIIMDSKHNDVGQFECDYTLTL